MSMEEVTRKKSTTRWVPLLLRFDQQLMQIKIVHQWKNSSSHMKRMPFIRRQKGNYYQNSGDIVILFLQKTHVYSICKKGNDFHFCIWKRHSLIDCLPKQSLTTKRIISQHVRLYMSAVTVVKINNIEGTRNFRDSLKKLTVQSVSLVFYKGIAEKIIVALISWLSITSTWQTFLSWEKNDEIEYVWCVLTDV